MRLLAHRETRFGPAFASDSYRGHEAISTPQGFKPGFQALCPAMFAIDVATLCRVSDSLTPEASVLGVAEAGTT